MPSADLLMHQTQMRYIERHATKTFVLQKKNKNKSKSFKEREWNSGSDLLLFDIFSQYVFRY